MRPIKFRAFGGSKRMIPWEELQKLHISTVFQVADDYHVMQFTGLHDKNGKEIYEGDIVKMKNWSPENYQIKFIDGAFCLAFIDKVTSLIKGYAADINYVEKDAEIIGNVYENPELISQ